MSDERAVAFEDPFWQRGFTKFPNEILFHPGLTPEAKITFVYLSHYAWANADEFPGQEALGEQMGVSDRSIRTYMGELEAVGLLVRIRRGLGKTNLYRLRLPVGAEATPSQTGSTLPVPVTRKKTTTEDTVRTGEIRQVWEHWEAEFGTRWKFDTKRKRIINSALDVRDVATCKSAITGLKNSEHHNGGKNGKGPKYIDLQYALKGRGAQSDESVIDRMAELGRSVTKTSAATVDDDGVPAIVRSRFDGMVRLYENRNFHGDWRDVIASLLPDVLQHGFVVEFSAEGEPLSLQRAR